jgi:hypothetical protein
MSDILSLVARSNDGTTPASTNQAAINILQHVRAAPDEREPEVVRQLTALEQPLTQIHADGYVSSDATHMNMLVVDGVIRGKVEFSCNEENRSCFIHWLCAPGYGTKLLGAFEKMIAGDQSAEFRLMFKVEAGHEMLAQKRVNFYIKNGYRLLHSKLDPATGYHMLWWKGYGRRLDWEVMTASMAAQEVFDLTRTHN